jgi:hypothetical protein
MMREKKHLLLIETPKNTEIVNPNSNHLSGV